MIPLRAASQARYLPADRARPKLLTWIRCNVNSPVVNLKYQSHVDKLPNLSRLARQSHRILETGAGIERQFSIVGLTLTNRGTSLDLEQLYNILRICAVAKLVSQL